jgi:hypothetical protein
MFLDIYIGALYRCERCIIELKDKGRNTPN